MLPALNDVRYVGTEHFSASIARAIVTALNGAVTRALSAGTAHADYVSLVGHTKRFVKIIHTESDEKLSLDVVQALTKYWVKTAWGKDLLCVPASNAAMIWKISAKDADYRNFNNILPAGEATAPNSSFFEYRPYGSIPGEWRLFKGQYNWWVTFNGTHGNNAACRAADWWVWPNNLRMWCKWTIPGAGSQGNAMPLAEKAQLPEMTAREKYLIKMMRANADNENGRFILRLEDPLGRFPGYGGILGDGLMRR